MRRMERGQSAQYKESYSRSYFRYNESGEDPALILQGLTCHLLFSDLCQCFAVDTEVGGWARF